MSEEIALITGANKGIGFELARQLGAAGITIVVGSRDMGRGEEAVSKLSEEGLGLGRSIDRAIEQRTRAPQQRANARCAHVTRTKSHQSHDARLRGQGGDRYGWRRWHWTAVLS